MGLYNFTGWGFFVTIGSVFLLYAYIRQFFIALASDWGKLNDDLRSKLDDLQRSVDGIERRLKRQESGYDPLDY